MDIRLAKDAFSKAKLYGGRKDYVGSLKLMLQGLREVISSPGAPTLEFRSIIREVLQFYASEQFLKDAAGSSLSYTPGEEKALYTSLRKAYAFLVEQAESEAYEEALKRKKRLDKQIILGKKYLAENKIAEADLAFEDSLQYHKDETTLFTYIAKILVDANHEARALPYLKKAIGFDHTDQGARNMMQEILSKREQS